MNRSQLSSLAKVQCMFECWVQRRQTWWTFKRLNLRSTLFSLTSI